MNAYDKFVREIRDRRREELDRAYLAWQDALRRNDALRAAFAAYQHDMVESAQGLPNTLGATRSALAACMKKLGLSRADFEPAPRCKACGDTGYSNGRYCKCVLRAAIAADSENLSLPLVDFDAAAASATGAIASVYPHAKKYVDDFPGGKPFMALIGPSGTGKTYLAAAVTTGLIAKGASAVSVTAFNFVRRALDFHKQFTIDDYVDRFTPMLDADLLVIDDLGKETMLKNITIEYLYAVVNERWLHKKHTVFTSNLSPSEILTRYGEAITSRLIDKNRTLSFMIKGKNARFFD